MFSSEQRVNSEHSAITSWTQQHNQLRATYRHRLNLIGFPLFSTAKRFVQKHAIVEKKYLLGKTVRVIGFPNVKVSVAENALLP